MSKLKATVDKPKESGKSIEISQLTLMQHIEKVVAIAKESKLTEQAIAKCLPYASVIAETLALTEMQAILLSLFVNRSDDEAIRINDISAYLNCMNVTVLSYSQDIDAIVERGYLRKRKPTRCQRYYAYQVPHDALEALKNNRSYTAPCIKNLTPQRFFDHLCHLFHEAEEEELSIEGLSSKTQELLEANPNLQICKAISRHHLSDDSQYEITLLLYFCHKLVNQGDDNICFYDMAQLFGSQAEFNSVRSAFKNEWHGLVAHCIVETKKDDNLLSRDCYCLTDEEKDNLLSDLNMDLKKQSKTKDIIAVCEITPKPLYYNPREQTQIGQLCTLLDSDNFTTVQGRLAENGMRKGFACLFYGAPGTGKTETAYQVARKTGRNIMVANVSEIKSMWVGESEKNIKALFDRYRTFTKQTPITPILLFNEADAVLGIRQQGAEHAVDKMENSIQNIILQEMEGLDGIMIATTNLTQNLDKAFERRFLYKIEFSKPSMEAKMAIWHSMIPSLSNEEALELAEKYDFSGGQIENIARKRTVDEIINGRAPSLEDLHAYCHAELLNKQTVGRKIGY